MFKQLSSDSFEICCKEMFLTYPSQTRETSEAPFRPIPFHIQAQQKHQRHNTHSFCKTHILTLKKTGSFVWILSIYFSSVFNTIQPHLKESKPDVNPRLILWILDFLVECSQTVHHQAALSSSRLCNIIMLWCGNWLVKDWKRFPLWKVDQVCVTVVNFCHCHLNTINSEIQLDCTLALWIWQPWQSVCQGHRLKEEIRKEKEQYKKQK